MADLLDHDAGKRNWGGRRAGSGRRRSEVRNPGVSVTVYFSAEDYAYFQRWGEKPSDAIRRILDRSRAMWPRGE